MIEFKFACPGCGQRLQVTDEYSGRQINCPACQKPILVPQPPGGVAPARAASVPPPAPQPPAKTAPLPAQAPAPAPAAPPPRSAPVAAMPQQRPVASGKKSKTKWIIIGSAAGVAIAGAVAFVLLSGKFSSSDNSTADQPAKSATASADNNNAALGNSQKLDAADIIKKCAAKYDSLTSYSATGTSVMNMDMSKVDPKNMPGVDQAGKAAARQMKQTMSKPIRTENELTVKLGKPDMYLVEWHSTGGNTPVNMKGAAWSAGDGDFILVHMPSAKYVKMEDRGTALNTVTGLSAGAAGTLPAIFFNDPTSQLTFMQNPQRRADEAVDGEDCYVLDGTAMGMKETLWITKDAFLLKKKEIVLGGNTSAPEPSDAQLEASLNKMGKMTAAQKAQAKASLKKMKPMMAKMKGSMTETYRNIETNQPVTKDDFKYDVPAGTKLSKKLF